MASTHPPYESEDQPLDELAPRSLNGGLLFRTFPPILITLGILLPLQRFHSPPKEPWAVIFLNTLLVALVYAVAHRLFHRYHYGQKVITWNKAVVTLYQGSRHIGTQPWTDLARVTWEPSFFLRLTFKDGEEWVVPRQWTGNGSYEQAEFRHLLTTHHPPAIRLLVLPEHDFAARNESPVDDTILNLGLGSIFLGGAAFLAALNPWDLSTWFMAGLGIGVLAVFGYRRWRAKSDAALGEDWVKVTDEAVTVRGQLIPWTEVKAVDWSGSNRETLHLSLAKESVSVNLSDVPDGPLRKREIEDHPRVQELWRRQIALEEDLPLTSNIRVFIGQCVLLASLIGLMGVLLTRGDSDPRTLALQGLLLAVFLGLAFFQFSKPLAIRLTQEGIGLWHARTLRYEEVTGLDLGGHDLIRVETGARRLWISKGGSMIGRLEAILRFHVPRTAFEDGEDNADL
jgi:hypothetical protein